MSRGGDAIGESSGFSLVNALPFRKSHNLLKVWMYLSFLVRHLPTWFPGAGFHKRVKENSKLSEIIYREPFNKSKQMIVCCTVSCSLTKTNLSTQAEGTAMPSITSKLLEINSAANGNVGDENFSAKVVANLYLGAVSSNRPLNVNLLWCIPAGGDTVRF